MLPVDVVLKKTLDTVTDHTPPPLRPITLDQLTAGSVVICATRRLAQTLARAHDAAAQAIGNTQASWQTLNTTTFQQWLAQRFAHMALRGHEPPALSQVRLLDPFQERLIWEQVIHEHLDHGTAMLFDVSALASTAAEAHALIINWAIPDSADNVAFASEEQAQFRCWRSRFLARCQAERLIDGARLNAALIDHLHDASAALPEVIAFAGFDHITPLEAKFQAALRARGCTLYTLTESFPAPGTAPALFAADHQAHECLSVARWATETLQRHPDARIGIVVPDLASYRNPLTDALEDMLDPALVRARHAAHERPFNISLGQPLSTMPVVRTALTLLRVLGQPHAVEQSLISALLHSPYWSARTEADARARLDAGLRDSVAPQAPLQRYRSYAHYLFEKQDLAAPHTQAYLQALQSAAPGLGNQSRLPSAWRRTMQSLLGQCGWLADGHLGSAEFQTREAFAKELGKLAQLDQITGKITFNRALSLLSQLCSERLFQPQTRGTPPIQILGALEAAGLEFDAVWVMGLSDNVWPPAAKPNPLLPAEAQRAAGSPNACATVQLDFARRIQQRLLRSAPEIRISYPRQAQAVVLQPSPLINDFGPATALPPACALWAQHALAHNLPLAAIDDARAPAIAEGAKVSGGTGLLRAQAICPAWGFYQYRLGAKSLAEPIEGLDPRKRGTLVHDTLEIFWKATHDLATLQSMSDATRRTAIAEATDAVLSKFNADQKQEALKPRQTALERQRLIRLIDAWLQLEARRKEDFCVLEAEGARDVIIEGIAAHMRIDRIDQLADGRTIIIDYKTGASIDTKNWARDRITEPQLPIYAAIAEGSHSNIAGVAFGLVHIAGLGFKGITQEDQLLPGVHGIDSDKGRRYFAADTFPDWPSLLAHWSQAIHQVAREIREGDAGVRLTAEADIAYCEVKPLLRIAERAQQLEAALSATAEETTEGRA